MSFPARVAIATRNDGKVREIRHICSDWPVEWITFPPASWPEVEETGSTYLENALLKARTMAATFDVAALSDDSGLEVDALGGRPGPRSARFAGEHASDEENLRLLIDRIRPASPAQRTARYRCVAACGWPDGRVTWAEGTCEGRLVTEPRGTGGFGYDPIFVPKGEGRTMAQLPAGEKNVISHRARAFRSLGERLAKEEP